MGTWKTKISYGDTVLFDGDTSETAWSKTLATNGKLMNNGNVKVDYYYYVPLPTGCIAEYLFDGNTNDTSGNGYNLSGTPTYTTGKIGQCITPSGDLVASSTVIPIKSDFSISCWVKWSGTSVSNQSHSLLTTSIGVNHYEGSAWWRNGFDIAISPDYTNGLLIMGTANGYNWSGFFVASTWVHLVVTYTYSSKLITIYKNGASFNSFTWASLNSHTSNMHVGWGNAGGDEASNFPGNIDLLRIYDHVLTTDEIALLYNNGEGA